MNVVVRRLMMEKIQFDELWFNESEYGYESIRVYYIRGK